MNLFCKLLNADKIEALWVSLGDVGEKKSFALWFLINCINCNG